MSWWDAKGLTSIATNALKTAQKKIDKVLDIKEEDDTLGVFTDDGTYVVHQSTSSSSSFKESKKDVDSSAGDKKSNEDNFFTGWLSPSPTVSSEKPRAAETVKKLSESPVSSETKRSQLDRRSSERSAQPARNLSPAFSSSSIDHDVQRISSNDEASLPCNVTSHSIIGNDTRKLQGDLVDDKPTNIDVCMNSGTNDRSPSSKSSDDFGTSLPHTSFIRETSQKYVTDSNLKDREDSPDQHSSVSSLIDNESFQVDSKSLEQSVTGWSEACDSELWQASMIGSTLEIDESNCTTLIDSVVSAGSSSEVVLSNMVNMTDEGNSTSDVTNIFVEEICHSSTSDNDIHPVQDVSSLEGSLEASADELSEGNKTVIADDSDTNRDDTDVDDMRLDSMNSSGRLLPNEINDSDLNVVELKKIDIENIALSLQQMSSDVQVEAREKSMGSMSPRSTVSTGSYVKNLIEDAMVDNVRESADTVRNESGGNSGHTSADEIDTTTSSDIEILSHTSASGLAAAGVTSRNFDVSPSRQHMAGSGWTGRTGSSVAGGSLHRRSDSGSSAQSLQSRTEEDFASPDGTNNVMYNGEHNYRHGRENRRHSSKYDSEFQQNNPYDIEKLLKKLAEMAEVLEAREKKQLDLCHENADLTESNNDLRNRLQQQELVRESEISALRDESLRKLNELEKKLQTVTREKESLKTSLHESEIEIARRSENIVSEKLLKEKEQTIIELMEEGEKLSKKQLQQSNVIKKLRLKEKESDSLIASQKIKTEEQKTEIERLESILDSKVDSEKKHIDAINQLNAVVKVQEDEINRLKSDLEDAHEKYRTVKTALDNSYKEISELHKARVTHVSEAHKAALDLEISAKEQLAVQLEDCRQQMKREQLALVTQIEDLQLCLSRMEKEHGRREDIFRQEISDLQQRLQESEERKHELTQSVSGVTRPLLRQIENLQTTYAAQTASYERVEKSLTDRLAEAQAQLAAAVEKERFASEKLMDSNVRLSGLESQITYLRQERSRLVAELEVAKTKADVAEEAKLKSQSSSHVRLLNSQQKLVQPNLQRDGSLSRPEQIETSQREMMQQKMEIELTELKKEKVLLENQLEMEKMKVETGKKKVALLHDQIHEKDVLLQMTSSANISQSPAVLSREDSINKSEGLQGGVPGSSTPVDMHERMYLMTSSAVGSRVSLYDSLRQTGSASLLIENLQSELKQREGEINQLQSEIAELERTRESMARELVTLSIRNEDLTETLRDFDSHKSQYKELDQRYNALLQMYGEKVEETQELMLDLQDVKDMYKSQIDELLRTKSVTKLAL